MGSAAVTLTAVWAVNAPTVIAGESLTSGVTAPVRAATPVTTAVNGTGFTGSVAWFESDGTTGVTGAFAASTVYVAKVTLTASSGYTLTGLSGSFTHTGATTVSYSAGVVTITFPATGATPQTVTPTVDYAALAAAKAAADKAAADKAAADKLAAEKAAAEKAAADKLAAEKAAAEKAAALAAQALAEAKAAAEAKEAAAQAAAVAAAQKKAAANTGKLVNSAKGTRIKLDLADKYWTRLVYVEVIAKTKTGTRTTVLDYFFLDTEDGTVDLTVRKLKKGEKLQVRVGKTVLYSKSM
jgi:type II secretory pathway pseudopilin PulG